MYSADKIKVKMCWALALSALLWAPAAPADEGLVLKRALPRCCAVLQARKTTLPAPRLRPGEHGTRRRGPRKHLRPRLYLSAALAAGAGAVAWWSRHEADHSFRQYRRAAGRRRQEDKLGRARRFDRLTGTAFILMEAGIALTTVFLFF